MTELSIWGDSSLVMATEPEGTVDGSCVRGGQVGVRAQLCPTGQQAQPQVLQLRECWALL